MQPDDSLDNAGITLSAFQPPVTALINGASRGIGLALVQHLSRGTTVERVYATARAATTTPELLQLARVQPLDMDVTDEQSIASAARQVAGDGKTIDLLINTAGLLHDADGLEPERRLADVDPDNLVRSYRVNALGPLLVAKHFAACLPRDRHCAFANLSARVGSIGDNRLGGWYAYRAAKAAQNQITRTLSIELRRRCRGIVCVALHPGTVATALSAPFTRDRSDGQLFSAESAAQRLLAVIDGLDETCNGLFYAYDGSAIPW